MVSSRSPVLRNDGLRGQSGNVLGISGGDAASLDVGPHDSQQLSSSTWSRSEPSSLTSLSPREDSGPYSASPPEGRTGDTGPRVNGHAAVGNLDEERFEAFGAVEDADSPAASPTANPAHRNPRSPNSTLLNRHSWLRTSLGRSSAGANRKRLSSNALASQLYRSSSFNSSGRGSICDTADDVYSSLEDGNVIEDVIDLNQRVQMIQEQMHALVDTQSAGEERYARVKQENATLQARILMLEETARDAEARAEEKLDSEQRRHRELASRLEREKELQLENYAIKLQAAELESSRRMDEAVRLRGELDKLRPKFAELEAALEDAQQDLEKARDAERRTGLTLAEVEREKKLLLEELARKADLERKLEEMADEMDGLRTRYKDLEESRDEMQAAAAALQAGRQLLMPEGQDPNDNTIGRKSSPNLATELRLTGSAHDQADCADTGKPSATDICDNFTTLAEAKQALKEQREVNTRLRSYIDNILLNIVENYPQLLEVKQPH
ncbi:rab11 family-interacting protein 4A [Copidosoma floridanum]|uniref:rab11 family-interacting protein 4A n=1 Tax=Copidosoma floridanum TaxID=29053 RepID=UPI0006C9B30B|nr:rab11 family-interacting protein 4A [Copidosoma floridanum]